MYLTNTYSWRNVVAMILVDILLTAMPHKYIMFFFQYNNLFV